MFFGKIQSQVNVRNALLRLLQVCPHLAQEADVDDNSHAKLRCEHVLIHTFLRQHGKNKDSHHGVHRPHDLNYFVCGMSVCTQAAD